MTMEAYAFCARPIKSIEDWQASIDALGFDLRLRSARDLADHRGHLPALWRGREAGLEFGACAFAELAETYDDIDLGGPWPYAYAFYFAALPSCVGTWLALAACLTLTDGVAFDPQEGRILRPGEAARYAQDTENEVDRIESGEVGRTPS
ncbi:hypothetical protein FV232_13195 [Methylobacterium sp. WL30]|uniref:hypothetical protein n=1 Tax=unclassified Methylobacterium TaxID=2615210 RepID=UPI0011CA7502|nr:MULTISPECIES: hypothetical protein [unclassified Methylobacterium]TXM90588.1 hypothetical protein FV223_18020 [Methylobacterium sp. WL116]TXN40371.1 hypothetical protein FV225_06295 [Methylobacterium sp. WL93]TXN52542.1 hypothetical protein FV227_03690 [Methylobacterium sp. WL119]TXN67095.1 hypothetical protein FV232_13195 [Methylobacterium sp. WL30]